jgi:hypothetical protein
MNFAAFERAEVAAFGYRQAARTGSIDCMRAVCFILRNRVKSAWGNGSWLSVIESAPAVAAHEAQADVALSASDRLLQIMVRDVDDIYLGQESYDDRVRQIVCAETLKLGSREWKPVLYYSFVDREQRSWFVENIIRKPEEHPHVGQIGTMMLYR